MKQEIKARWTTELRSGRRKQGEGSLRDKYDRFCCLGVLCELAVSDGVIPEPTLDEESTYEYGNRVKSSSYLPPAVRVWAGISSENPRVGGDSLSNHNDGNLFTGSDPKTFPEIADLIDKYL